MLTRPVRKMVVFLVGVLIISACVPVTNPISVTPALSPQQSTKGTPTPLPTREKYSPGQLVDYLAQSGDTLPALAAHFNTTEAEIRTANPTIPDTATTLPAGFPMKIPIYYQALWGPALKILPEDVFVNGPANQGFDFRKFISDQPGWLKSYSEYVNGETLDGAGIINYISTVYSLSPKLVLTLVEYQSQALSQVDQLASPEYLMGFRDINRTSLYQQLILTANVLNNGYYGWRTGRLHSFTLPDGTLEFPDPWQNAATVGVEYFFSQAQDISGFKIATLGNGFLDLFTRLFGDPWTDPQPVIPGSLQQPTLLLPFTPGTTWVYTGGPHTGWGSGDPLAAIDFAPPLESKGCQPTDQYALAVADGVIVRVATGVAILDLDRDGDERTGWDILYLHITTADIPPVGTRLKTGDRIGRPSCEGGETTGTHVHIARKYNGEWIPADGALPFDLEGWIAHNGGQAYLGTLTRNGHVITACTCSDVNSAITAGKP